MEKEENVYEGTIQAEEIAKAKESVGDRRSDAKEASAALGKFKDVDALLKAYGCLQAEFTRRSQRLKALEKAAENSAAEKNLRLGETAGSGAEKLRKNALARRAEEEKFDAFVADLEKGGDEAKDVSAARPEALEAVCEKEVCEETEAAVAPAKEIDAGAGSFYQGQGASSVAESRKVADISSRELYERASKDEEVRLKIIGEYLSSIGRAGAPLTFGGAGALAAPSRRAKTIDEAGTMALRWFKKDC